MILNNVQAEIVDLFGSYFLTGSIPVAVAVAVSADVDVGVAADELYMNVAVRVAVDG